MSAAALAELAAILAEMHEEMESLLDHLDNQDAARG